MTRSNSLLDRVAQRRTRYTIGAVAAAAVAFAAGPASAQYGTDAPLPPLPPLQGEAAPAPAAPAPAAPAPAAPAPNTAGVAGAGTGGSAPAGESGVAGAVGSGDAVPAAGTAGEIRDTGVGAPAVRVLSSERSEPAALGGDDLPFTGASIALFALIGVGLLALGLGVRRRSGVRTAKP